MKKISTVQGFTLIELMVTIAIFVIISALAIPFFKNLLSEWESKTVSTDLVRILHQNKHHAFMNHQRLGMCGSSDLQNCDNAWNKGIIVFSDQKVMNRLKEADETIVHAFRLDLKHGSLTWNGFGLANNLVFQADNGLPRGSQGSFVYCSQHQDHSFKLILSQMGHARIEEQNC